MKKLIKKIVLVFLTIPVIGCGNLSGDISYDEEEIEYEEAEEKSGAVEHADSVYVSVTGGVKYPGVYILPEKSRVYEAINAAGGVSGDGDASRVNLVDIIKDGQQISVPFISVDASGNRVTGDIEVTGVKVNINTATYAQLMTLTGIGESKAKAIVAYRDKNGAFLKTEDLMKVSGIKEGTFEKIKDDIVAD